MKKPKKSLSRRFCVAPMMDWTDRYCRVFHRLLTQEALLYTEMLTAQALIFGNAEKLLSFHPLERPLALQLGGSDPDLLAKAAQLGGGAGYDEINLNVGCPSDRVQSGRFGACLMAEADLVGECISALRHSVQIPVTVKCRVGIDDMPEEEGLYKFITTVKRYGCEIFIIHARKAWLKGLSPKENRSIPPLNYPLVYKVKNDFPELEIIINGGIVTIPECLDHLNHVDGVMLGRAAYENPYILAEVDSKIYNSDKGVITRESVLRKFIPYVEQWLSEGVSHKSFMRHILGLYNGQKGARAFRRSLSTQDNPSEIVSYLKLLTNLSG